MKEKNLPRVAVLLSAYNGQRFLEEQLNSIVQQDGLNSAFYMKIYIRDDGSTDNTQSIIRDYSKNYPMLVKSFGRTENVGVKESFFQLIDSEKFTADYYFLSDQDDVWGKNKILLFLSEFAKLPIDTPSGVYSDLWIADKNAKSTGTRMSDVAHWDRKAKVDFRYLCFDYRVTGAAFAFNDVARRKFEDLDNKLIPLINMHDSFMALYLSLAGDLRLLDKPTVNYRQHGDNVVGAIRKKHSLKQGFEDSKAVAGQLIIDTIILSRWVRRNNTAVKTTDIRIMNDFESYYSASNILSRIRYADSIFKVMHHRRKLVHFVLMSVFDVTKKFKGKVLPL